MCLECTCLRLQRVLALQAPHWALRPWRGSRSSWMELSEGSQSLVLSYQLNPQRGAEVNARPYVCAMGISCFSGVDVAASTSPMSPPHHLGDDARAEVGVDTPAITHTFRTTCRRRAVRSNRSFNQCQLKNYKNFRRTTTRGKEEASQ